MTPSIFIAALIVASVHLIADKLRFLEGTPRSIWLSAAGGISVAYVFLHLLPELAQGQSLIRQAVTGPIELLEHHAYLVALAGLVIFYGLESTAKAAKTRRTGTKTSTAEVASPTIFWLHIASFAIYNLLVGYLLVTNFRSTRGLIFFSIAMGLHFLVNDFGLREHYKTMYPAIGRWLLSTAVLLGCLAGFMIKIPELAMSVLVALIAGGVILNVLKEELPAERESRFSAFLAGTVVYAALLLAI